jgi:predicted nucleic acid-binding protein
LRGRRPVTERLFGAFVVVGFAFDSVVRARRETTRWNAWRFPDTVTAESMMTGGSMRRIYLDLCAWKRAYDRMDDDRVRLEALAVASLFEMHEQGTLSIVRSPVLLAENSRNPVVERQIEVDGMLRSLPVSLPVTAEVEGLARRLAETGLGPWDALHVACAELGRCEAFVTTDDRLLGAVRRLGTSLRTQVTDPLDMVRRARGGA